MNTEEPTLKRRVLTRRSAEDREQLIEEYRASGLTRKEFCAKHEIHPTTFHGWFKKRSKLRSPEFREVALPAMGGTAPIEIELPKGVYIRLRDSRILGDLVGFIREVTGC